MKARGQELLYLLLMLLFSCAMVIFRLVQTHTPYYGFLIKNLLLACIPLLVALAYVRLRTRFSGWGFMALCLFFWLLFFPNAPYIASDLVHLPCCQHQMPDWYDPLMVLATALTGLWAGFLSMREFEAALWHRIGIWPTRAFIALVWFLSGIGIYLGRVLRWNSWNLFTHPGHLLKDVIEPFLKPAAFPSTLGLIACFSAFFWLSYLFWRSHAGSEPDGPEQG
ncbi:MAG: DUF1361 domain-containing protein [Candidatus Sericytochromatia bacterium]